MRKLFSAPETFPRPSSIKSQLSLVHYGTIKLCGIHLSHVLKVCWDWFAVTALSWRRWFLILLTSFFALSQIDLFLLRLSHNSCIGKKTPPTCASLENSTLALWVVWIKPALIFSCLLCAKMIAKILVQICKDVGSQVTQIDFYLSVYLLFISDTSATYDLI